MSKRVVILMRHGDSPLPFAGRDHDRPLSPRGETDAQAAGKWLAAEGFMPDQMVASSARRTAKTAILASWGLNFTGQVREDERLYEAPLAAYETVLDGLAGTVMLVGHNPTIEEALESWVESFTPSAPMTPASVAVVDLASHKLLATWHPES